MKKKYSVNVENDQVVSVEVDGVKYDSIDQIPDPEDRKKMMLLMSEGGEEAAGTEAEDASEADDASESEDEDESVQWDDPEMAKEMENMHIEPIKVDDDKMSKIMFGIFFGIAVLLLVISAVSAYFTIRSMSKEQTTEGRVVDMVRRVDSSGNEIYYPVVQFTVPSLGSRTVQIGEGSWPPSYSRGDRVTVAYNADQPNQARIKSAGSALLNWLVTMITGGIGAIFLVVSILVYRFTRPEPSQTQQSEIPSLG